jgi:ABC-type lipopolysaccharide export system ATPase subunit
MCYELKMKSCEDFFIEQNSMITLIPFSDSAVLRAVQFRGKRNRSAKIRGQMDPVFVSARKTIGGIMSDFILEMKGIMNEFAARGKRIIVISSELPEILGMSDQVFVMHEGQIVAELVGDQMNPETIMKHSIGQGRH